MYEKVFQKNLHLNDNHATFTVIDQSNELSIC